MYVEHINETNENIHVHYDALDEISNLELREMIRRLPDGCRTVFNMYAIEGYAHKEIAEALNISVGTSKSQLSDARRMLRKMIKEQSTYQHNRSVG